ncbi:hypothetical protein Y1Q_0019224 [Alligator mississippiensis]|uniref:Uncharacterized protein n=1 Tax=Alligator mississippiensis TaxID=8496 RepID=A0A151MQF2_ALLMI|nr:hypothetical protein Y1Q_0019224 [Alligator mississippiensis]
MDIGMIAGSDNNIVKKVPMIEAWVLLSGLTIVTLCEDSIHDEQIMLCTLAEEEGTIGIDFPHPLFSIGATPEFRLLPNSCIEVTNEDELVFQGSGSQDCVKSTVKLFLVDFFIIKCGGICTDDHSILVVTELEVESHKAFVNAHKEF